MARNAPHHTAYFPLRTNGGRGGLGGNTFCIAGRALLAPFYSGENALYLTMVVEQCGVIGIAGREDAKNKDKDNLNIGL